MNKEKIQVQKDGLFRFLNRTVALLLVISIAWLGWHLIVGKSIQADLTTQAETIAKSIAQDVGAVSWDVKMYHETGSTLRITPEEEEYPFFIHVKVPSLGIKNQGDWMDVFAPDGTDALRKDYGYDEYEYAMYARVVTSASGREHPVFLTLSDGDKSFCLNCDSYSTSNTKVYEGDAVKKLRPATSSFTVSILTTSAVCLAIALVGLICRKVSRDAAVRQQAVKFYNRCLEEELNSLSLIQETGREFAQAAGVTNYHACVETFYQLGESAWIADRKDTGMELLPSASDAPAALRPFILAADEQILQERLEMVKNGKLKKWVLLVSAVLAISVAAAIVVTNVLKPAREYEQAQQLLQSGQQAEAYAILQSLGDYKDSAQLCLQMDYETATGLLSSGDYVGAYIRFSAMTEHDQAQEQAASLEDQYPILKLFHMQPGERFSLGYFEQDNDLSNGPEPVEWVLLTTENGTLMALSDRILDAKPYNTANGDGSTLKLWLKEEFGPSVFTDVPGGFISKVTLITEDQLREYRSLVSLEPTWTDYALAQGPDRNYVGGNCWWLGGEYFHPYGDADILMDICLGDGTFGSRSDVITDVNGVRPMFLIDGSGLGIDHYAGDQDDFENAGKTTRTEADVSHSGSSNSDRPCSGGSVGCRAGFHPCNEQENGYCNRCCKDAS